MLFGAKYHGTWCSDCNMCRMLLVSVFRVLVFSAGLASVGLVGRNCFSVGFCCCIFILLHFHAKRLIVHYIISLPVRLCLSQLFAPFFCVAFPLVCVRRRMFVRAGCSNTRQIHTSAVQFDLWLIIGVHDYSPSIEVFKVTRAEIIYHICIASA